ncbi:MULTISPECIES: hypothetical protein [unclassified Streptomyces]|uniref:hypothetical protein n=1 Tax=unclassified Streptomyces TaxID=2593676 RepID=UPI002E2E55A1|nr:hypothetical protein [Streptomyces sp. NBC_00273]
MNGALYCAHRGARKEDNNQLPLRWTSFTPAASKPFIAALEKAAKPPAEGATEEQEAQRQKDIRGAAEALEQARKRTPDIPAGVFEGTTTFGSFDAERLDRIAEVHGFPRVEKPALVDDNGTLRMVYPRSGGGPSGSKTSLRENHLTDRRAADWLLCWSRAKGARWTRTFPYAPSLAVLSARARLP